MSERACWFHGGEAPVFRARALGIQSPWLLGLLGGPALLIVMGAIIAFLWFAFSLQARKVEREIDKLARQ